MTESVSSIVDVDFAAEASSYAKSLVTAEMSVLTARFALFTERTAQTLLDDLLRVR
jgi:hypothetical protein